MIFSSLCRDAAVTIPFAGGTADTGAAAAATTSPAFTIPETYKDRPYLKGVDSTEKVFAMLDGAQTLIGKRPAGIPASDAIPEEWDKFYEAVGRPKTAAEYKFEAAQGVTHEPKLLEGMKPFLHKAGLTQAQVKIVQEGFDGVVTTIAKEKDIAEQQQNTNFDELANKTFGQDRVKILATAKGLIDAMTPATMKPEVAKLSNENLIILAGVLNEVHKKYIKEDGPGGGGDGGNGGTTEEQRAKIRGLMSSPEYTNPFHVNHEKVKKEVNDFYQALRK